MFVLCVCGNACGVCVFACFLLRDAWGCVRCVGVRISLFLCYVYVRVVFVSVYVVVSW